MTGKKSGTAEPREQNQRVPESQGLKKIVIGRLAVDPIFLMLFLFFGACSLLMLAIMFSSM